MRVLIQSVQGFCPVLVTWTHGLPPLGILLEDAGANWCDHEVERRCDSPSDIGDGLSESDRGGDERPELPNRDRESVGSSNHLSTVLLRIRDTREFVNSRRRRIQYRPERIPPVQIVRRGRIVSLRPVRNSDDLPL